ncbi:MAG: glucans biosynthesis glucosyltransferase MdoH, partial [Gluconacetobacter diazotrophicus]|nr:glucans biosynthesis glucosyltransferase MdoH [Gluconacetobacter diazotrophicus]
TSALLGLWPNRASRPAADAAVPLRARTPRTAILLPIFNEPPGPIACAVRIMADDLRPEDNVSFFLLSDTQDPDGAAEEAALFPASTVSRSGVPVFYRRRAPNTGRKAGNIAEFCHGAGRDFDYALILDADSLMTAASVRALIAELRDDPTAGLVQANSYPIGGQTLWARMQQFGARLNTPLSVSGQHFWQHRRGTYWGHNAILRLRPFNRHAMLPTLPGAAPLGGEILCHDTVEAAMLLRANWQVRLAPAIAGSYETVPSNLIDHLARERRWSQGNLQHLRLLPAPGFKAESRLHILTGILFYLAAPIGLLLSLLLLANGLLGSAVTGAATGSGSAAVGTTLLCLTLLLLFGPKLAAVAAVLRDPAAASRFGGRGRFLLGVGADFLLGTLIAPVNSVSVSGFVLATLCGRVVSWNPAARGDRSIPWSEACRRFRVHTAIGTVLLAGLAATHPVLAFWSAPFLLGLVLSIPLAVCTSSVRLGLLARRFGLFLTEDELFPTAETETLFPDIRARPLPSRGRGPTLPAAAPPLAAE